MSCITFQVQQVFIDHLTCVRYTLSAANWAVKIDKILPIEKLYSSESKE